MKHKNLLKSVEKYAQVSQYEHGKTPAFRAEFCGYIITWLTPYYVPDEAHCVNVRHVDDKHDWVSDYHAGSYYDTIKSAIEALTYNFKKEGVI